MIHFRFILVVILAILLVTAGVIGCGKKGDPVVTNIKPVLPDVGLKLEKTADAVVIGWPVNRNQRGAAVFQVEKSGLDPGTDCPGCPRNFEVIAEISAGNPDCGEDNNQRCRYIDYNVLEGYRYIYRLLSCDGAGRCSVISSPAEIKF